MRFLQRATFSLKCPPRTSSSFNTNNVGNMLRRAPTSISLSKRDVVEHLENIDRKKCQDREKSELKRGHQIANNEKSQVSVYGYGEINQQRARQERARHFPFHQEVEESCPWEESGRNLDPARPEFEELLTVHRCTDPELEDSLDLGNSLGHTDKWLVAIRHKITSQQPSRTPRNTLVSEGSVGANADQFSSYIPHDVSDQRDKEMLETHRLRYNYPLPRSAHILAQDKDSPERHLTSNFNPCVTLYGTPGTLLSQPAQRPRSYRPRAMSYSFEESERDSAAYEDFEGSNNKSSRDQIPLELQNRLNNELQASFSQRVSLESNMPSSPPEFVETSLSRVYRARPGAEASQRARSSPRRLPLPPPFSTVRRNISLATSLPLSHEDVRQARSQTLTNDPPQFTTSPVAGSTTSSHTEDDTSLGPSNILRNLAALPLRLLSAYRSRSPFQTRSDGPGSGRVSPLPPRSQSQGPEEVPPTSTRRRLQIYDDSMPAISQPQTPQHLPEARHQSRFHPSYTAPVSGRMESPGASRLEVPRRRRTRSDSPQGMETPGFRGLYGGQENIDEDVLFDRAAQRLWALSSARRRGRSMSNTPDREPSFADSRGDNR